MAVLIKARARAPLADNKCGLSFTFGSDAVNITIPVDPDTFHPFYRVIMHNAECKQFVELFVRNMTCDAALSTRPTRKFSQILRDYANLIEKEGN